MKKVGTRMVECKNLPTDKMVRRHPNDLKKYSRTNFSSWQVNLKKLPLEELDVELDIHYLTIPVTIKPRDLFNHFSLSVPS
jgi:hypothetical protein